MRPAGEVGLAILRAVADLEHEVAGMRRGPTLTELARKACVGVQAARRTVDNLRRAGKLVPVAERKVEYRNRPVAEYAVKRNAETVDEFVDVGSVFGMWVQR